MFTRHTKSTWIAKVVLVVAAVALLVPVLFASAQGDIDADPLDPNSAAQNPVPNFTPDDPQAQPGGAPVQTESGAEATTGTPTSRTVNPANPEPTNLFGESALKALLYTLVVNLFGTLVGWAGILLDFGINKFVIGFGTAFNTQGVGQAVNQLWSLVRDFFNILFIFGFIWIGFQMILDSSSGAKKTLITLIMAALLVNFSLFISKFVVDFSNRLASEIAQAAFPLTGGAVGNVGSGAQEVAVADTFFAHMGVPQTIDLGDNIRDGSNAPWAFIFGSAIFYLVAAFVFAAGGIMLIIRFVALSIFMVLSPFMFLGWVFPGMQGWTSKYWKGFLGRAFYAPVYIVLLFFAGTILQNFFGNRGSMENDFVLGGGTDNGFYGAAALGDILPAFILSCAFLIAAVQVAGKMSADGASGVMKVGNSLQRGGRRFVTRNTVGLGAYGISAAGRGAGKYVDRFDAVSQSSRGARIARGALNTVTLGATSDKALRTATGAMAGASIAGSQTREQYVKEQDERKKRNARITTRAAEEAAIKAAEGIDVNSPNLNDEQKKLLDAREAAINNYSSTELEQMGETKRNKLVGMLKAGTVSKLLDSDNLSATEKASLQAQYRETIEAKVLDSNKRVITEELTKLSDKQLEVLGNEFAQTYAGSFSDKQIEGFMKSDSFTERQKGSQKAARISSQKTQTENPDTRKELFRQTEAKLVNGKRTAVFKDKPRKATELASLPYEAFVSGGKLHADAVQYLTVDTLKQMARNARQGNPAPTDEQRQELALELMNSPILDPRVANYLKSKPGMEDFEINQAMIDKKQTSSWSDPST